jgi:copper chaperone CopZ
VVARGDLLQGARILHPGFSRKARCAQAPGLTAHADLHGMITQDTHRGPPMQQEFRIDGMHCNGCVARVTKALQSIADDVQVTLDPPRATLESPDPLSLDDVRKAVKKAGDYVVTPA